MLVLTKMIYFSFHWVFAVETNPPKHREFEFIPLPYIIQSDQNSIEFWSI